MTDALWDEIEDEYWAFKRSQKIKKKLTRVQWDDLNELFVRVPDVRNISAKTQFMPSGLHFHLMHHLDSLGYRCNSREEALQVAEDLLIEGYDG